MSIRHGLLPLPLPPLSRLRPFEAAARLESFSLAADELGMTQTAVSKQIGQLEGELGTRLFERRNRAVFLTDAGRRLGHVVGTALADIATEVAHIRGQRRSQELVLHCQLCEAFYWLMPRLSRFHEQFPGVELRVLSALNPLTQSAEAFDVAIQTSGRASGVARLAFTAADEIFPVCAPALVEDRQMPLSIKELLSFPLLSHSVIPQDWMEWHDWLQTVGLSAPARPRIVPFDSYPVALQAAVTGQGIALGWRRTTEAMIAEGKLIRPCRESVARSNELSVFRSAGRDQHPDTDRLLKWLECELAG
ncbi:LysR substrate-binding domain-containing protein [Tateyamaria sp. syn59]|uniref:LysR substrate-binding domain-containing protein n=1 Tax=Tateyamaria sp. syn59 TaxID=2576942 RepID=UPI0011BF89D0|nr:LysR substrate-binding domain-containing protein [Tateyamaria sp. syn59]